MNALIGLEGFRYCVAKVGCCGRPFVGFGWLAKLVEGKNGEKPGCAIVSCDCCVSPGKMELSHGYKICFYMKRRVGLQPRLRKKE